MSHQLGFDALLADSDQQNRNLQFERETAHLPETYEEAFGFHGKQIVAHNAAVLDCDFEKAFAIREEAHLLAKKLNGGKIGIMANDDAPGCVLSREFAAEDGRVPYWRQKGRFTVRIAEGINATVEMDGMFGIGATAMPYFGFSIRAADKAKSFISETGYRSFLGVSMPPKRNETPKQFVERAIASFIEQELKGKLIAINPRHETYQD